MEKKDIYEHLAKIYLDVSAKDKKKARPRKRLHTSQIAGIVMIALLMVSFAVIFSYRRPPRNSELAMVLTPGAIKINFNFDPAKKESYTIKLNNLDLTRFKALSFSCRRLHYGDNVSVRVEFTSTFKEKSEVYFTQIPQRWETYTVSFSAFKNISDWSNVESLSFIVEEWNTKDKNGIVYIDNVRLLG